MLSKFGNHRLFQKKVINSRDLNMMTSLCLSNRSQMLVTYLLTKFGGHRSYGSEDINHCINTYINVSEKAELATSICNIEICSKSKITIYNFKV